MGACATGIGSGWEKVFQAAGKQIPLTRRPDPANDTGHCLVGPIAVRGAQPGQVLQVDICHLVPASVGATWVGEVQEFLSQLGIEGYFWLPWHIHAAVGGVAEGSAGLSQCWGPSARDANRQSAHML